MKIVQENGTGIVQENGTGIVQENGTGIVQENGTGIVQENGTGITNGLAKRLGRFASVLFSACIFASAATAETRTGSADGFFVSVDEDWVTISYHGKAGHVMSGSAAILGDFTTVPLSVSASMKVVDTGTGNGKVVDTGTGNDKVVDTGTGNFKVVDTGTGNDKVVDTGTGNFKVVDTGTGNYKVVDTGTGNFKVVDTGTGNDKVVDTGTGNFKVVDTGTGNNKVVDTGTGNDKVVDTGTGNGKAFFANALVDVIVENDRVYGVWDDLDSGESRTFEIGLNGGSVRGTVGVDRQSLELASL